MTSSIDLSKKARGFCILGAIIGWIAVGLQFYLIIENRVAPIPETIIRFFSFFTILTNTLVAICFSVLAFSKAGSGLSSFFRKPTTLTAITGYILVVGIVYQLILRQTWDPEGLQKIVDELLHTVTPPLFLLFWIIWVPKKELSLKNIPAWLIYPLVYLVFVLVRGSMSGFYPYPFIDVTKIGMKAALINSGIILIAFLVLMSILIGLGKLFSKKK